MLSGNSEAHNSDATNEVESKELSSGDPREGALLENQLNSCYGVKLRNPFSEIAKAKQPPTPAKTSSGDSFRNLQIFALVKLSTRAGQRIKKTEVLRE